MSNKEPLKAAARLVYLPNDPSTPGLVASTPVPVLPAPCPPFSVVGWTGVSGVPGTPQFQAALVYQTIATALNIVQPKVDRPISAWASNNKLVAYPRAGNQLNAYYDRAALKFFYNLDTLTKKIVFSCESSDVVSHETGHAILDALRPDLWGTASLEIFAYHEAFGDIIAVCTVLEFPQVVDLIIRETNGDLTKPNTASRVAEEMGQAIYHATSGRSGKVDCLRNAVNAYTYIDPDTLPVNGAGLVKEPHSFSQVFTATWYDIFSRVYAALVAEDKMSQPDAVKKARDVALTLLLKGTAKAASVHDFYASVAKEMVAAAGAFESGRWAGLLRTAFEKRKILTTNLRGVMKLFDTTSIDPSIDGHKAHVDMEVPVLGHANLVVDIPAFGQGMGMTTDQTSQNSVLRKAARAVKFAHQTNLIGKPEDNRMFFIANGRLHRSYICNAFCPECNQ